ncbi:MAG TPA: hypothetical protein VES42_16270 [Pilimelia sp.]|nr:hypothetical protein [Pilimelia sp.]
MPLSENSLIQTNGGAFNAGSGAVTLPSGTTAGNTILIFVGTEAVTANTPTGFKSDGPTNTSSNARAYVFRRSNVPAGETSWTLNLSGSGHAAWRVVEVEGLMPAQPLQQRGLMQTQTGGVGVTDFTVDQDVFSRSIDALQVTMVVGLDAGGASPPTVAAVAPSVETYGQPALDDLDCSIMLSIIPSGGMSYTAGVPVGSIEWTGFHLQYLGEGSPADPVIDLIWGFEAQTAVGWGVGPAGYRYVDAVTGTPAINTTTPRSGLACVELSASAAAESISSKAYAYADGGFVARLSFYFPTALPAGDVELFNVGPLTGRYRTSGTRIGLQLTGGTEVLTSAVSANGWYSVDFRLTTDAAGNTCEWTFGPDGSSGQVQTTATGTGAFASSFTLRLGWSAATTATVRYDDVVATGLMPAWPLGDYQVRLQKVSNTSDITVAVDPARFGVFTNNGTVGAWSAANARTALREMPPVFGATASGIAQRGTSTSDWLNIPFDADNQEPYYVARGVLGIMAGWANGAQANEIRLDLGTVTIFPVQDPNFDTASIPGWVCGMGATSSGYWTQADINSVIMQFGRSGDAGPALGGHWIALEVAWVAVAPRQVCANEETGAYITAYYDGNRNRVLAFFATAGPTVSATATYIINGTTYTDAVPAGTTVPRIYSAAAPEDVSFVGLS